MAFFNITSIKSKSQQSEEGNPAEIADPKPEEGQLAVDVLETATEIVVLAPIAGVTAKNVKVAVSDDVLTISGTRKLPEDLQPDEKYFVQECYWGEFSRAIVLPAIVDPEAVTAKFRDGVLRVSVPKSGADNAREIEIEME